MLYIVAAAALILVSIGVRLLVFPVATSDYIYFVSKWFVALEEHRGLTAFLEPFANYAPLYLYVIKFLTWLPIYSLWSVKAFSVACDIAIAYVIVRILKTQREYSLLQQWLIGALVFIVPTLLINSSLWGQSDAFYALPVLISFYYILKENPRFAVLAFGIAISIKVQAIFFLPMLVGYLWRAGRAIELVWIPVVYVLVALPALIAGATFAQTLLIYMRQAGEYTALNISSPSLFAFWDGVQLSADAQQILFWLGIFLAGAFVLLIAYLASRKRAEYFTLALMCVLALPYALPRMHERYFYLADVFAVLFALAFPKRWFVVVGVVTASLLSYVPYLSGQIALLSSYSVDLRIPSVLLVAVLLYIGVRVVSLHRNSLAVG